MVIALGRGSATGGGTETGPERLAAALRSVRFVAYTPRAFRPSPQGAPPPVPAAAIAADLDLLRPHFDGLITYTAGGGMEALPALAEARGFRALVIGVWNPLDRPELDQALDQARRHPGGVVALTVGNEGLFGGRYSPAALRDALKYASRRAPGLPLGTSEPFAVLLDPPPGLLEHLDLLLPNIHPLTEPWFPSAPESAAWEMVVAVVSRLQRHGKPILVKETGLPSAPASAGLSPERQARFWRALRGRLPAAPEHSVAAFEAFDAPWKPEEIARYFETVPPGEAHWGFFTAAGESKPALEAWLQGR
jgi:exo-beta-1,3-glucanase (GH17 family)